MLLTAGDVQCNIIDYLQQVPPKVPTFRRSAPYSLKRPQSPFLILPDLLQCEHFRLDVTVLCLPRMAYHWFPKIVADLEVLILRLPPTILLFPDICILSRGSLKIAGVWAYQSVSTCASLTHALVLKFTRVCGRPIHHLA